ncbi:AraC family transcriptional regulator (plasmid) [Rhizobium sp. 32-5/1]|nr:AraC family transcriptional regulator [Rhizobium sp. 32-5/1]WEZ85451.1 AraC family transcriptional regulator [Rhizobium sp. 32-5/1]
MEDLARFDELTPDEHSSYIGLSFERAAMVQQVSELLEWPVTTDLEFDRIVDLTSEKGLRLAALGHLVWSCLNLSEADRLPPAAIDRLFQATMIALLEVAPNSYMRRLERSLSPAVPWQVKRAIEYMHSNLAQSMTVGLIAAETGTNVRALQAAFQRFKGITPLGYLRTIRLEAARRTLVGDGGSRSISDAARNVGSPIWGGSPPSIFKPSAKRPRKRSRCAECPIGG